MAIFCVLKKKEKLKEDLMTQEIILTFAAMIFLISRGREQGQRKYWTLKNCFQIISQQKQKNKKN